MNAWGEFIINNVYRKTEHKTKKPPIQVRQ